MSGMDTFADIERLKRDLNGVQRNISSIGLSPSMPTVQTPVYGADTYAASPPSTYQPSYTSYPSTYQPAVVRPSNTARVTSTSPRPSYRVSPTVSPVPVVISSTPQQVYYPGQTTLPRVVTVSPSSYSTAAPSSPELIFNTIEEYLANIGNLNTDANKQRVGKLLLPPDVQFLHSQRADVMRDFMENLQEDKRALERDIDDFLKGVIETMDKVKEILGQRIDNYAVNFENYYHQFMHKVDAFMNDSIGIIQK